MMKVKLAGYNVDTEVLEELKKASPPRDDVTPETLSAAYARISRDARPVDELRSAARREVARARKSNQAIIFKMGHHSVAEHAVFNFDIIGVSRLAIEQLERFRLCSFTEKSQRYITLGDDYVIPKELQGSRVKGQVVEMIQEQNELYHKMVDTVDKENARYITALATQGQLGMTINARNLELLFRRFASQDLEEVKELGRLMFKEVQKIAPSIILFTEANEYDAKTYGELKQVAQVAETSASLRVSSVEPLPSSQVTKEVELVDYSKDGDDLVAAALIHTSSNLSYKECLEKVKSMSEDKKKRIFEAAFKYIVFYDAALREFEYADLTYDLIISSACFGQLKRHRLSTQTYQDYDPSLGITVPHTVIEAGFEKEFRAVAKKSERVYQEIFQSVGRSAQYVLTNAHRRRVLLHCNARELYHISRLREDPAAQWDIRNISLQMSQLAKKIMPLTMMKLGGKDIYEAIKC